MDNDFEFSDELLALVGEVLMEHMFTLLFNVLIGFVLGSVVVVILFKVIRKSNWFKRSFDSSIKRLLIGTLHLLFYVSIIGISCTISLHVGSVKIVKQEVTRGVDYGLKYCQENYFEDEELIQSVFDAAQLVMLSGEEVSDMNEVIAQGMVDAISEKYGLGFMGDFLFDGSKNEMVTQLEAVEKAIVFMAVSKSLEYIGQDDLIDADQLEDAFNEWIHSDYEKKYEDVNKVITTEIVTQVKPFIASIWLPFYLFNGFIVFLTLLESVIYYNKKR